MPLPRAICSKRRGSGLNIRREKGKDGIRLFDDFLIELSAEARPDKCAHSSGCATLANLSTAQRRITVARNLWLVQPRSTAQLFDALGPRNNYYRISIRLSFTPSLSLVMETTIPLNNIRL